MRGNPVKDKLAGGEFAFGTMIFEFLSPGLPAVLQAAGAEFALYDMEHSGFTMDEMKAQFAYCRGLGLMPLVRPPAKEYQFASRLLDLGAMGLMYPMVESREEAERIVSWTRYPPRGVRGAMFGGAHDDYGSADMKETIAAAEARTIVLALIETAAGVEHADEILAVPGIDGAHLGQADLSISMGVPGEIGHAKVQQGIDALLAACKKHGKFAGCLAPNLDVARDWMGRGFRMISYSYDIGLLRDSLATGIATLRKET